MQQLFLHYTSLSVQAFLGQTAVRINQPYDHLFSDTSFRELLTSQDLFYQTCSLQSSNIICKCICIALTVLYRSHLTAHHDWLIGLLLFSHYLQQIWKHSKAKPNPGHFRQHRNHSQDLSGKKRTYGHPRINRHLHACDLMHWASRRKRTETNCIFDICLHTKIL